MIKTVILRPKIITVGNLYETASCLNQQKMLAVKYPIDVLIAEIVRIVRRVNK